MVMQGEFVAAPLPYTSQSRVAHANPLIWLMSLYHILLSCPVSGIHDQLRTASDLFLGASLIVCLLRLRFVRGAWSMAHAALILAFLGAAGTSVYLHGAVSSYVTVKIVGLLTLYVSYLCLTTAANTWREIRRFMRIFIFAVGLHCLIAVAGRAEDGVRRVRG